MEQKRVEFYEEAYLEAFDAFEWYLERSERIAGKFLEEIGRAVEVISSSPSRWPEYAHGTRRFVLHRFPFAVVYREIPSCVQIVAVAHMHRRPGYWKGRK